MRGMIVFLMLVVAVTAGFAEDDPPPRPFDSTWVNAIYQMAEPQIADSSLRLRDYTIQHHSFEMAIDSADLFLLPGLFLPNDTIVYGVFLTGRMTFDFRPPVRMEQDQLQRFFKSDTLTFTAYDAILFFDSAGWEEIRSATTAAAPEWNRKKRRKLEEVLKPLTDNENYWFVFSALRAAVYPRTERFLLVNAQYEERDQVVYLYDPYRREQVHLFREHDVPGEEFMELVCRYTNTIDSTYATINGEARDQFEPVHYDISASIDDGGTLTATTTQHLKVLDTSAQFVRMALHAELEVDSIVDDANRMVSFLRYEDDDNKQQSLYVFFPGPYAPGDSLGLTFYYQGEIAKRKVGEFYVEAGAAWYPRLGYAVRTTHDIEFKTPRELTFILSGELIDSTTVDDTLITRWQVTQPATNISFNIGHFTLYEYGTDRLPIELYYNEPLHRHILQGSGQRVYKDVGEDLTNSLVLFDSLFGAFPYRSLTVSEILLRHGESFPGFLHLGAPTFMSTDHWGADHLFRAHEAAHQWFGSTVGYATYHDQWLSEGFAEYAALLYFEQVFGEEKFREKLRDYREEIYSARKYLLWSGEETGPIALGFRTASSKTEGDFGLIIYKKGAYVLQMLRDLLTDPETGNDEQFFVMMREFVARNAGRAATTADFQAVAEEYFGQELTWFFQQWVYGSELPVVEFTYEIVEADTSGWLIEGALELREVTGEFRLPLTYELEYRDGSRELGRLELERPLTRIRLLVDRKPKKMRLNPFERLLVNIK